MKMKLMTDSKLTSSPGFFQSTILKSLKFTQAGLEAAYPYPIMGGDETRSKNVQGIQPNAPEHTTFILF